MVQEPQKKWDVFISHSSINKPWVRERVAEWQASGLKVFFDEEAIEPGEIIPYAIERGISNSRKVVLVLTPASLSSRWVAMELSLALFVDPDAAEKFLVPVILEPLDPGQVNPLIKQRNAIILTEPGSYDREYQRLLQAIGLVGRKWSFPIISAMGTKGGTGKTTVMRAIAELIASTGDGVLIIDSDITSAGMAHYYQQRAAAFPAVWTVLDNAYSKQNNQNAPKRDLGGWDVTPAYLKKQGKGHIFLIPARAAGDTRLAFNALANIVPDERRNEAALEVLRETIDRVRRLPIPIKAVLIDSGADNNPLVSAAVALADYAYIISNPNASFYDEIHAAEVMHTQRYPGRYRNSMIVVVNQATPESRAQWSAIAPNASFIDEDSEFREKAAKNEIDFEGVGLNNLYLQVLNVLKGTFSSTHQGLLPDPLEIWVKPYLRGMKEFPESMLARPRYRFLLPRTILLLLVVLSAGIFSGWKSAYGFLHPKIAAVEIAVPSGMDKLQFSSKLDELKIPASLSQKVALVHGKLIITASLSGPESELIENSTDEPQTRQSISDALRAAQWEQTSIPIFLGVTALVVLIGVGFVFVTCVRDYQRILLLRRIILMREHPDDRHLVTWLQELMIEEPKDKKLTWLRNQYRDWLAFHAIAGSLTRYRTAKPQF
jgi:cellulose biosynthesis protein BcsQ